MPNRNRYKRGIEVPEQIFRFDPNKAVFTPKMAKRNSAGPFAAGLMVQGRMDGSGTPDNLTFPRGNQIVGNWYQNIDPYQGAIVFWITPEWNGDDGLDRFITRISTNFYVLKNSNLLRIQFVNGPDVYTNISSWIAGTTYCVVFRWDCKNAFDGTNYACVSINDTHTFGGTTTLPLSVTPFSTIPFGIRDNITSPANAVIEGLTIYRRPLFDGTYGIDVGNGDEIAQIYNSGSGKDPTEITGSWDVVACFPTDSNTATELASTGQGWSHPHSSNVLKHGWLEDGGYLGGAWVVKFAGGSGEINCGSGAGISNLADGAMTAEGWFALTAGSEFINKADGWSKGWILYKDINSNSMYARVFCATTDSSVTYALPTGLQSNGKFNHIAITFDDAGDRRVRLFVDGVLVGIGGIGVGAVVSDTAKTLYIAKKYCGVSSSGLVGWCRISNIDRYGTTNFLPSRTPPAPDANTLAQWNMSEGSGTTVTNVGTLGSVANGTITNGTWERQWENVGSPTITKSVGFNGSTTDINCGSEVSIDNLHDSSFTAELWCAMSGGATALFVGKASTLANSGWLLFYSSNAIYARVKCTTTDATAFCTFPVDKRQHHLAMTFNDAGDRKVRLFLDGILAHTSPAGVGSVISDSSNDLKIGKDHVPLTGNVGWTRISNIDRYGTINFTPPPRNLPPTPDANTIRLFKMNEGAGNTIIDYSSNAQNATLSNGTWNNTPDMAIDSPGARVYNWGYVVGADAAGEGIKQVVSGVTPGSDYVLRALAYSEDAIGQPKLQVWDETNGAEISSIAAFGQQDNLVVNGNFVDTSWWIRQTGWAIGSGVATKTPGQAKNIFNTTVLPSKRLAQYMVTYTISNQTTGVLQAGCGFDWNATIGTPGTGIQRTTNGTYTEKIWNTYGVYVSFGFLADAAFDGSIDNVSCVLIPDEQHPEPLLFSFELPTIARNGSAADCTSFSVRLLSATAGVVGFHQCELLSNLLDNPSFDTGSGDPYIPYGWTNVNLIAGEATKDTSDILGSASLIFTGTDKAIISPVLTSQVANKFYSYGVHTKLVSGSTVKLRFLQTARNAKQATGGSSVIDATSLIWAHTKEVVRNTLATDQALVGYGVGTKKYDNLYLFALDDIPLTVTPTSAANSIEGPGIQVGGMDTCVQPIPPGVLMARKGRIRFRVRPRHSLAAMTLFGNSASYLFRIYSIDLTTDINVYQSSANMVMEGLVGGVSINTSTTMPSFIANTEYLIDLSYTSSKIILKIGNLLNWIIPFSVNCVITPSVLSVGSNLASKQLDAVFSPP